MKTIERITYGGTAHEDHAREQENKRRRDLRAANELVTEELLRQSAVLGEAVDHKTAEGLRLCLYGEKVYISNSTLMCVFDRKGALVKKLTRRETMFDDFFLLREVVWFALEKPEYFQLSEGFATGTE